jgi:ribose transport system ATP-binding protein
VLLGRTLLTGAGCLLLFDPTRGIDAGTKLEIYDLIRQFAAEGGCVLLYSTEIPELVGLCDRIYVMYGGLMVEELAGGDLSEESVLAAAVGHVDEVEEVVV